MHLQAVCLTNHGDMKDYDSLTPTPGLVFIPGVEVSSPEGDFLVYSTNYDYLRGLRAAQLLPEPSGRPPETAVVWAHPFAGNHGGGGVGEGYIGAVASRVDGIEVYNGNWPDELASVRAREIASRYGLAELGGSDAHHAGDLLRCWTEVEEEVVDALGLVAAVLERRTTAAREA